MRFRVISVVTLRVTIVLDVTPYSLADRYQLFGGSYCLYLQHEDEGIKFSETLVMTVVLITSSLGGSSYRPLITILAREPVAGLMTQLRLGLHNPSQLVPSM
jgi:hypothetical protein